MATQTARAWVYTAGYPDTLKQTVILPPHVDEFENQSRETHLLVKIHACALNPVDIQIMNLPSHNIPWSASYGKEKGIVCDFSGTVLAGGRTGYVRGDEIFGITLGASNPNGGSLAEIANFDMAKTVAVKKPAEWDHVKAAAISLVWLTAKACVEEVAQWVERTSSKRVAILGGSSATGMYSILLAKKRGWKVLATSSGKNKDFVMSTMGADAHVDYTSSKDLRQDVSAFKPDAVIDCVGGTSCIGLPSSKRYITIVGDKTGRTSMGGPYTYYDYLAPVRAATQWLRWAWGRTGLGESYDVVILAMKKEWLVEATTLGADEIYVDSTFSFDDAKKAFERLNTGRAKGKVVVEVAT